MAALNDEEIIDSWFVNAKPWIKAIENQEIESRKLVTNAAIIDVIKSGNVIDLVDVGCGEGWLETALKSNIPVFGIDVVPALIEAARKNNKGRYEVCAYEDLKDYNFGTKFFTMVCNFSLIGKESTEAVFEAANNLLIIDGRLIIQTLHPAFACGDNYQDGWREGSWAGFSNEFSKAAPWYFRTLKSWYDLFVQNDLELYKIHEPINPKTGKPASIIFEAIKT